MVTHFFPNPNYRPRRQTLQLFGIVALTSLTTIFLMLAFTRDPYAKYRDVQLVRGMWIDDIKAQLGEPDVGWDYWTDSPGGRSGPEQRDLLHPHYGQQLKYGAFGARDDDGGDTTRHRLSLTFTDGKLISWGKSKPVGER